MYFVGIDLAWGERNPTGVAAIDDTGSLRHVGVAGSDGDVLDQVAPFVRDDCVVAIDAPLIVENPSGNRPCESELNRDFRRFDASTYPSNRGLAWFADGGRGSRLCAALGLSLDPRSGTRRALEVYPHAASVVLFGLPKTLKYKKKTGRDVAQMRSELLSLIRFVEGLGSATPKLDVTSCDYWAQLAADVGAATRASQLRRAEDPVDAVLCAYIANFAAARPKDVTVYGEVGTGCIVTPSLRST